MFYKDGKLVLLVLLFVHTCFILISILACCSGVYNDPACKGGMEDLDHAVQAVGYGTDPASGLGYWIVRNSWCVCSSDMFKLVFLLFAHIECCLYSLQV